MSYQLLVSRAKVTSGDEELASRATVSVRNGVATIKGRAGADDLTMKVASVEKGRRSATVTGVDGTVWTVTRAKCLPCGGGR